MQPGSVNVEIDNRCVPSKPNLLGSSNWLDLHVLTPAWLPALSGWCDPLREWHNRRRQLSTSEPVKLLNSIPFIRNKMKKKKKRNPVLVHLAPSVTRNTVHIQKYWLLTTNRNLYNVNHLLNIDLNDAAQLCWSWAPEIKSKCSRIWEGANVVLEATMAYNILYT